MSKQESSLPKEFSNFICLGVVVNSQNEVLLIKRKKVETGRSGEKLTWAFPGGKILKGESREECVVREVLDETGYKVRPIKQINLKSHPSFPVIIAYFLCELESDRPLQPPTQPWEIEEIRWVKPSEIKSLITTPLDSKVADELKINQ